MSAEPLVLGSLSPQETETAVRTLNDWYRQEALEKLPLESRAWMEGLGRDELRLLWHAGQPRANFVAISESLGIPREEVELRLVCLRRKLKLQRKAFERLARDVARFAGTITNRPPSQN